MDAFVYICARTRVCVRMRACAYLFVCVRVCFRYDEVWRMQTAVAELVFATTGNKPNMDMLIFNVDPNVDEAGTCTSTKVASCTNTYELVRARASHHDTLTGYPVRGTSLHAQWL